MLFLFLSHQIYSTSTPALAQFSLSAMKLKHYSHSTSVTLLLSISSKATGILHLFPRLSKLASYCTRKGEERMEIKGKPCSWSLKGLERIFPTLPIAIGAIGPVTSRHGTTSHKESLHLTTDDQKTFHNVNFKYMILFSSSINLWIKP